MVLFFWTFSFQRKLIHNSLNTLVIYLKSTIAKFLMYSPYSITFFVFFKNGRNFRRQGDISLFNRIVFSDFVIVRGSGQSDCFQQIV